MIPNNWVKKNLGDICSIEIGGTPARNTPEYWDTTQDSSNLWVSIKDINQRTIYETSEKISDVGIRNSNAKLVKAGSVLMSFKLTIGKVAFAGKDLYTNEAIAALQSNEVDLEFLFYGLQQWNLLADVDQAIKGATLNKKKLRKIETCLPVIKLEQEKIAEVLTAVDRTITQTESLIAKYQRIKTGLMQDLFTRGIDENGNLRDPATHAFKEVEGYGNVPVEWTTETLGDAGSWLSGGTPKKNNYVFWRNGTIPWVTPKDMKTFYITDSIDHVTALGMKSGTRLIPENTVLIVVRGMILAHTFPVAITKRSVTFNQDMKAIKTKPSLLAQYLGYWFASKESQMLSITTESTHGTKRFDLDDLQNYPITLPPLPEQEQIVTIIDTQTKLEQSMVDQLNKLNSLKRGLMQDLLTGKVSVAPLLEDGKEN